MGCPTIDTSFVNIAYESKLTALRQKFEFNANDTVSTYKKPRSNLGKLINVFDNAKNVNGKLPSNKVENKLIASPLLQEKIKMVEKIMQDRIPSNSEKFAFRSNEADRGQMSNSLVNMQRSNFEKGSNKYERKISKDYASNSYNYNQLSLNPSRLPGYDKQIKPATSILARKNQFEHASVNKDYVRDKILKYSRSTPETQVTKIYNTQKEIHSSVCSFENLNLSNGTDDNNKEELNIQNINKQDTINFTPPIIPGLTYSHNNTNNFEDLKPKYETVGNQPVEQICKFSNANTQNNSNYSGIDSEFLFSGILVNLRQSIPKIMNIHKDNCENIILSHFDILKNSRITLLNHINSLMQFFEVSGQKVLENLKLNYSTLEAIKNAINKKDILNQKFSELNLTNEQLNSWLLEASYHFNNYKIIYDNYHQIKFCLKQISKTINENIVICDLISKKSVSITKELGVNSLNDWIKEINKHYSNSLYISDNTIYNLEIITGINHYLSKPLFINQLAYLMQLKKYKLVLLFSNQTYEFIFQKNEIILK